MDFGEYPQAWSDDVSILYYEKVYGFSQFDQIPKYILLTSHYIISTFHYILTSHKVKTLIKYDFYCLIIVFSFELDNYLTEQSRREKKRPIFGPKFSESCHT